MRFGMVFIVMCALCGFAEAAFEHVSLGGRSVALGGASAALIGDYWGFLDNPSVLSHMEAPSVSLFYAPNQFEMPEFTRRAMLATGQTGGYGLGFSASQFGCDLYRETEVSAGFAPKSTNRFSWGCSATWYHLSIAGYGSDGGVFWSCGMAYQFSPEISAGADLCNILGATIGKERENLPRIVSIALLYSPVAGMNASVESVKDFDHPIEWRLGLEYTIAGSVSLRCGTTTASPTVGVGFGFELDCIECHYGMSVHSELGPSHTFTLTVNAGGW